MSRAPEAVSENELGLFFRFDGNEPLPAEALMAFIAEVSRIAHTRRHFGSEVIVDIVEISTGSKWARLSFNQRVALSGLAIATVALANDLTARIQQPDGRLALCTGRMVVDQHLYSTTVVTCQGGVEILREMIPAADTVRRIRASKASIPETRSASGPPGTGSFGRLSGGPIATRARSLIDSADGFTEDEQAYLDAGFDPIAEGANVRPDRPVTLVGLFREGGPTGLQFEDTKNHVIMDARRAEDPMRVPIEELVAVEATIPRGEPQQPVWIHRVIDLDRLTMEDIGGRSTRRLPRPGAHISWVGHLESDGHDGAIFIRDDGMEFGTTGENVDSPIMFGAPCVITGEFKRNKIGNRPVIELETITELSR